MILISLACAESISMQNNYPSWEVSTDAGSTFGGEALGGFIQGWDGRDAGGEAGETVRSLLNYNKPPNTVNNQKAITGELQQHPEIFS